MSSVAVWVPAEPAPYTAANRRRAEQEALKQRAEEERKRQQQIETGEITAETDKAHAKQYQSDIYDTSNDRNKPHSHRGLRGALSSLFRRKHDKKDEDADIVR